MPKTPMDYSKCCIYKIEHIDDETLLYVGHTTNFSKRKGQHKNSCKNENANSTYNLKLYQMIRENGGFEMFKMIEVEKYPCKDRREAEKRENELMKELKASMNTNKSFRTEEEKKVYEKSYNEKYRVDNKETIKEYRENYKEEKKDNDKKYYELNKEIIKEQKREYREANKDKIKEKQKQYREDNKETIKEYREDNKERISEKCKEYYENNKNKILEQKKEKTTCEYGCRITKRDLIRHQATKKHMDIMNKK